MLRGRIHLNEDPGNPAIFKMARLQAEMLFQLGVKKLILTCAAGSLILPVEVGQIVVVRNFVLPSSVELPLWGGEHVMPEDALTPELAKLARNIETRLCVSYGSYAYVRGPGFEGRAHDKENLRRLGADIVGMSMVPSAAIAQLYQEEGVQTLGLAYITNDNIEEHSHEENRRRAIADREKLAQLLENIIKEL
jgi:purine nucleoside phosphorylase